MSVTIISPTPRSQDGRFYATNNPYQMNGPKGFTEFRYMEETSDLYVRLDFPGVIKESVKILLDQLKKAVFVFGDAPKDHAHDSSLRKYGTATGLVCNCCEISNIQCFVGDGVVRLILSKRKINPFVPSSSCCLGGATMPSAQPLLAHLIRGYNPQVAGGHPLAHLRGLNTEARLGSDPQDPAYTGPALLPHPSVLEGPKTAYEAKQLPNGGLYLRIDMPGVPKENIMTVVEDGVVNVIGRAPNVMYDSSGRYYAGKVAVVPGDYDSGRIKMITKHGVLRLIIPPPL